MYACIHAPGNLPLLLECAGHFSPLIEEASPDTVVFDIRGLQRLFGAADQLAAAIERRVGIEARIAIAANPDAAVHAARGLRGVMVLPPGREAAILAPLPLFLLGGSEEFAHNLDLWGIRTFGEFAELPLLGVTARLGEEGAQLQRLARGAGDRQLHLRVDPVMFYEDRELEDTIDMLEPLFFLLSQMLRDLCERLRFHGRATNEVRLRLKLERTADHITTLRLPVPMLNAKVLLKLLQLELNERAPRAPVKRVYLEFMPVEPRPTQHGLFLPSAPEPEKLEITLARIRGLVGAANVGAAEILDTHRPDAFRMREIGIAKEGIFPLRPKLVFRRLRPPSPAQVWCADHGRPVRIFSSFGGGAVIACAGPWRSTGDWWNDAWDRQAWDVEITGFAVARIFQDLSQRQWFLEGRYD